jgi:hypothetical protein
MTVDGDRQAYILDVPGNYNKNKVYRLVFVWHWQA